MVAVLAVAVLSVFSVLSVLSVLLMVAVAAVVGGDNLDLVFGNLSREDVPEFLALGPTDKI